MNKLKFSFKIKELELQVEGTREEVATITNSLGQQFKGLMQPTGSMGDSPALANTPLQVTEDGEITEIKNTPRKKKPSAGQSKVEKAKALELTNDPAKYGAPLQGWSALEKAVWLMHIVQKILNISDLSASEISETFNKHFKQLGKIRSSNISRDFGNKKAGAKAIVGENANVYPAKWFLTEEGTKMAERLIQSLKNQAE
jgi:hypothetical protein